MFLLTITIGIVIFIVISSILPSLAVNQTASLNNKSKTAVTSVNESDNKLNLISDVIENRIEKAAATLESTSKLPQMRAPLLLGMFSPSSNGIPENADLASSVISFIF